MLHLTNGDATRISETGLVGRVMPWRDVLHEGPVAADLDLTELSNVRARFIASRGWSEAAAVDQSFAERDACLRASVVEDEVVLWFEHDLYDQLQLIQILDWYAREPQNPKRLSLLCVDRFPGLRPFHGLGQLNGSQLHSLFPSRVSVRVEQLHLAKRAWCAFRSDKPGPMIELVKSAPRDLPFLIPALNRLLQEYPDRRDGLSRTERTFLNAVNGQRSLGRLFGLQQSTEPAPYLGDLVFATEYVNVLATGTVPLIQLAEGDALSSAVPADSASAYWRQVPVLTEAGRAVMAGAADRVALSGVDRWLGGVRLLGNRLPWRWDGRAGRPIISDA